MKYSYDSYGWLSLTEISGRETEEVPGDPGIAAPEVDQLWPNFTGIEWKLVPYFLPPVPPVPEDPPHEWYMYVGPFKDRLGMDALALGASSHDACKAIREMLYDRKFIDLKGAQVSAMMDILIATAQPDANPMFPGSGPMTVEKKAAILSTKPNSLEVYKGAA